jgi:hypothetical protein
VGLAIRRKQAENQPVRSTRKGLVWAVLPLRAQAIDCGDKLTPNTLGLEMIAVLVAGRCPACGGELQPAVCIHTLDSQPETADQVKAGYAALGFAVVHEQGPLSLHVGGLRYVPSVDQGNLVPLSSELIRDSGPCDISPGEELWPPTHHCPACGHWFRERSGG